VPDVALSEKSASVARHQHRWRDGIKAAAA